MDIYDCTFTLVLCAMRWILRIPGFPMVERVCLFCRKKTSIWGIILNTKGTLFDFREKLCDEKFAREFVPYASVMDRVGS